MRHFSEQHAPPPIVVDHLVFYAGLGFLAGPSIGNLIWRATNSRQSKAMEVMDKQCVTQPWGRCAFAKGAMADRGVARSFYEHIKARRVDPSYQSVNVSTWLAFS